MLNCQILDARASSEYSEGYIRGSININLDSQFAIWAGSILDLKQPILLVVGAGREEEAVKRLARTGLNHVVGYLEGGFEAWKEHKEPVEEKQAIDAQELVEKINAKKLDGMILDVRNLTEL